jgi:hypothetical protein
MPAEAKSRAKMGHRRAGQGRAAVKAVRARQTRNPKAEGRKKPETRGPESTAPQPGGWTFWVAFDVRGWMSDVRCSVFTISILNTTPPFPPTLGWSGGDLVPPWYLPIPIEHPKGSNFNQASLSKSLSCGFSTVQRCPGLDIGGIRR